MQGLIAEAKNPAGGCPPAALAAASAAGAAGCSPSALAAAAAAGAAGASGGAAGSAGAAGGAAGGAAPPVPASPPSGSSKLAPGVHVEILGRDECPWCKKQKEVLEQNKDKLQERNLNIVYTSCNANPDRCAEFGQVQGYPHKVNHCNKEEPGFRDFEGICDFSRDCK